MQVIFGKTQPPKKRWSQVMELVCGFQRANCVPGKAVSPPGVCGLPAGSESKWLCTACLIESQAASLLGKGLGAVKAGEHVLRPQLSKNLKFS